MRADTLDELKDFEKSLAAMKGGDAMSLSSEPVSYTLAAAHSGDGLWILIVHVRFMA